MCRLFMKLQSEIFYYFHEIIVYRMYFFHYNGFQTARVRSAEGAAKGTCKVRHLKAHKSAFREETKHGVPPDASKSGI